VALTDAGARAVRDLRQTRKRLFAELLADFDAEELRRFGDYLERLVQAFEEPRGGATMP
jgi:DNA-binding MarR family transcriptional regulator